MSAREQRKRLDQNRRENERAVRSADETTARLTRTAIKSGKVAKRARRGLSQLVDRKNGAP